MPVLASCYICPCPGCARPRLLSKTVTAFAMGSDVESLGDFIVAGPEPGHRCHYFDNNERQHRRPDNGGGNADDLDAQLLTHADAFRQIAAAERGNRRMDDED